MDFIFSLPLLPIHVFSVTLTLLLVIIADAHGALWLFGKMHTLPQKRMSYLHTAIWIGLIITIIAGALMFSTYPAYLLSLTAFRLKILFIVMLVVNAIFIGKHMRLAQEQPFSSLSKNEKLILIVSGIISTTGWIGAYTAAKFLG